MKNILLTAAMVAVFGLWSNAQTIENFESLTMNLFGGGIDDSISVIVNPDPSGINVSGIVGKMIRGWDGYSWEGWYATLETPVNVTENRYVHIKIWKPRISPVVFKYEGTVNSPEVASMNPQTLINQWEELVFDMSMVSGEYVKIVLFPDFENPLTLTEDIILYFDDLWVNDDPAPGSPPAQMMEDYEHIPLNLMLNGTNDLSSMTLVPNPDATGVNLSSYVIEFFRDKDGYLWDGFWSLLPEPIDVTMNKYVHVKVLKSRISPIRFKIEGGAAGTIEVESMYPQTKINEWEDIIFDFSSKTGTYPIIAFLPDFLETTEDLTIYFDEIILNDDPNPMGPVSQTFNIDMTESGMTPGSSVWISGALGGIYGTWNEPGTNPNNEMMDPDGDGIYSITVHLPDGLIAFKFFWGYGWMNGDPAPGGDRTIIIEGNMDVSYKWGIDGMVGVSSVIFNLNMWYQNFLGNFDPDTDFVDVAGTFNDWYGGDHHLTPLGGEMYSITINDINTGDTIKYKFRINGDWVTSEFPGGPPRTHIMLPGTNVITVWYNDEIPPSPGDVTLVDFEDGTWGTLTAHTMGCGTWDFMPLEETFTIVDNPDPSGINTSSKVCKFHRWGTNYGATPWAGFFASVFPEVDVTINKFVRTKVWKPHITEIRFKLEAGSAGTLEIPSIAPQTMTYAWEEMTFDFSLLWGIYPMVVFMPDYDYDMTIAEAIDIYFDDIIVGDLITGMSDPGHDDFKIYPNPVTDKLFIGNMTDVTKVEIYNVTGQVVKSFTYTNPVEQDQISTADLRPGMYILTIFSGTSSVSTKLLK